MRLVRKPRPFDHPDWIFELSWTCRREICEKALVEIDFQGDGVWGKSRPGSYRTERPD